MAGARRSPAGEERAGHWRRGEEQVRSSGEIGHTGRAAVDSARPRRHRACSARSYGQSVGSGWRRRLGVKACIEGCVVAHHDGATTTAGARAAPTGKVRTRCRDGGKGHGASNGEGTHTGRAAVDSGRRRRHGARAPGTYGQPVGRRGRSAALGWLLCRPAAAKHARAHHSDLPARPSHALSSPGT